MYLVERIQHLIGQVRFLLVQKITNSDMEGVMTDFSELMVLFLMLPVFIQIIIPLLMLVGFGLIRTVGSIIGRQESAQGAPNREKVTEDFQLNRA